MGHKVQVSFTDEQWTLIKLAKGRMGATDAEVIRNIVISWLAEKSIISQRVKEDIAKRENYAKKAF